VLIDTLAEYAVTVPNSTRSFLAVAVTKMVEELELLAKGNASPDNIDRIQAAVFRAQALQSVIKTETKKGQKAHTWLSSVEAERLLGACRRRPSGKMALLNLSTGRCGTNC
jgi:hypothetical protein